ncbi:TetR/AcrR family transcriptional regulator [Vagococcus sp. BWB3-3]|uniref:TetR/AcrR family transcriptional regulator n=1 Tax=Vagococcus allomyrinae TaxID=2794353 RepID=A0A940STJ5_9ENTE|nr:TetR/AcrR family transcriptional regulator [Vagococcus allomyrinae]MBP1039764.1 TetR/AcrR family transcriptional regulator [Vagococcus allomyrinae]
MGKVNSRKLELEKTRQAILAVASELFMSKGFKHTSTREIAERVQITQPNLYHHFKNKKDLYLAVITQLTDNVRDDLTVIVKSDLVLDQKLFKMIVLLIDKHPTNLFLMLNDMFVEMEPESHGQLYQIFKGTYSDNFAAVFNQESNQKALREGVTVEDAARFVLYNVSSMLSIQQTYQKTSRHEDIRLFVDFMLHGIIS